MKYNEAYKAHELYLCGASISKAAKEFNISRQRLHYYFNVFNLKTRSNKENKSIVYKGIKYTTDKSGYFRQTTGERTYIHAVVWKENGREWVKGMQFHYIDQNKENFSIENLALLNKSEHTKRCGFRNNQHTVKNPELYKEKITRYCFGCFKEIDLSNIVRFNALYACYCGHECKGKDRKNKKRSYSARKILNIIMVNRNFFIGNNV
jgi:hypothetical protein